MSINEKKIEYLQRALSLNPLNNAGEIITQRAYLLGLRKPEKFVSEEVKQRRRVRSREQIDELRKGFWTKPPAVLNKEVHGINVRDFPELQPAVNRIKLVSTFRVEFERLANHPDKHDNLFLALKRVIMVAPREAGKLKESYLRKVADGKDLKKIQKMVAVLKKEFPNIYNIERDWLLAVSKVKGRYVAPESQNAGSSFEFEMPGWLIGILIFFGIRILLVVMRLM